MVDVIRMMCIRCQDMQALEQRCDELRATIKQLEDGKKVLQNEVEKALGEQFRYQQQLVELRIQVSIYNIWPVLINAHEGYRDVDVQFVPRFAAPLCKCVAQRSVTHGLCALYHSTRDRQFAQPPAHT